MPIRSNVAWLTQKLRLLAVLLLSLTLSSALRANTPPRLITLSPHLTELAFEAGGGDHLVGVVAYSDYPKEALELPRIGDAFQFDFETILALDPTHALAWQGGTPEGVTSQLRDWGIEVVWIETRTLNQISEGLLRIAEVIGDSKKAARVAESFQEKLAFWEANMAESQAKPTKIFYQISERPLYTFGNRHVINEVFRLCSAENLFSDVNTEAFAVDMESVIDRQPDLILIGTDAQAHAAIPPLWNGNSINATIHLVDANLLVRPTPRLLQGIEELCTLTKKMSSRNAGVESSP